MARWQQWTLMAIAALLAAMTSTSDASSTIRVHITTKSDDTTTTHDDRDCEINGFKLRHHSLHYYNDKAYIACSHGRAGCYLQEKAHHHASQVSCPSKNIQQLIDAYNDRMDERRRLSLAVADGNRKWDKGVVCYKYNDEFPFDAAQIDLISSAMRVFEKMTNVRFLPLQTCQSRKMTQYCKGCVNFVDLKHPPTGRDCNSSIGVNADGPQIMNLADRCFDGDGQLKNDYGTAMHEIGHAVGLYHEHQHPGRKVAIFWDDISQAVWGEMKVRDVSIGGAYDPDSVMHYPKSYGFCYPKYCSATVTTNCVTPGTKFCNLNDDPATCVQPNKAMCDEVKTDFIGQRRYLSKGDLAALNELYQIPMWSNTQSMIA